MQQKVRLWLPFPPSVNGLFAGKSRRYKSEAYEAWIFQAKRSLCQQHFIRIETPVSVSYRFGRPNKRKRDIDNLFKAPNDLLVSCGVIADDSLIHRISGEWGDITGCVVLVEPFNGK